MAKDEYTQRMGAEDRAHDEAVRAAYLERKGAAYRIKASMPVQDPGGNSQSPHHTKTISSFKDTVDRGKVRPSGVTGAGMPAHDRPDDYDSEPIPHNVRGQQAHRDRGYY
jgi:hypothetical protein